MDVLLIELTVKSFLLALKNMPLQIFCVKETSITDIVSSYIVQNSIYQAQYTNKLNQILWMHKGNKKSRDYLSCKTVEVWSIHSQYTSSDTHDLSRISDRIDLFHNLYVYPLYQWSCQWPLVATDNFSG